MLASKASSAASNIAVAEDPPNICFKGLQFSAIVNISLATFVNMFPMAAKSKCRKIVDNIYLVKSAIANLGSKKGAGILYIDMITLCDILLDY